MDKLDEDAMSIAKSPGNRRRHLRFSLNELNVGYLDLNGEKSADFAPQLVGLIGDESLQGVRLIFVHAKGLDANGIYRVKVGKLPIMQAKVQWLKELDGGIKVVGLHYLE